ncbi:hypothetical protein BJ875DRAFT_401398 [Amylocarpus encephaloides]|uniref:Uncharacterized protein n=1 Tax=Amylocarpus encephaloides TaxID=45428 RepID=A0A9P7YIF4_9HELO|nr:hypothetical protein BJ875DRAFT_401398 [Amylocarpus encephaloides]
MDRNEGIVRWSPNPSRDQFMVLNLNYRMIQVYEARGHAQAGNFDYERISKHTEIPPINTYDWSPATEGLVAVGTSHGAVQLLRVDDDSNASITLPLKLQRSCQSVAFNTTGLLAVGLDRIRNDSCLQIWDMNQRLGDWDPSKRGWSSVSEMSIDPLKKLEASVSITSVRFFEDSPQTMVVGVKNQSVRIHDLRDPNSNVISFQTRCNNNIAIDFSDSNYFASSSLDHPGVVVWDRRVSTRATASPMYLESIDLDELPWGAALKLDRAIMMENNIHIKQLRYCRDQRGMLGVLSSAGQLQILKTNKEFVEPGSANEMKTSPEPLEVKKSIDLEYACFDPDHFKKPEDRIVSFDWLNLGTTDLDPRVVGLRANGSFEILQTPASSAGQLSQLIPWKPPRQLDGPYMTVMNFTEPNEREKVLGPLFSGAEKADVPVFGSDRFSSINTKEKLVAAIKAAVHSKQDPVIDLLAKNTTNVDQSNSTDGDVKALEDSLSKLGLLKRPSKGKGKAIVPSLIEETKVAASSRDWHDQMHYTIIGLTPTDKSNSETRDNIMLRRAVEGYLFNPDLNIGLVEPDEWLQGAWVWVKINEEAAKDDGMVAMPLDLSFMGVYPIWMNQLGGKSKSRLIDSSIIPDGPQWERLISSMNKRAGRSDFSGIATQKPHHRQLGLATIGLLKTAAELEAELFSLVESEEYTMAAARALFEGLPERAVEILKAGGSYLVFVAMALDIKLKSKDTSSLDAFDWAKVLSNHPEMADDPFLRAIYSFITGGDWAAIADERSLPMRDRVGVALRKFDDEQLTEWLKKETEEAINYGDIEGIFLVGITDDMVDIFAKYIEKFMDYQSPILIMSFCYPRYISDVRCGAWRKTYKDLLQRNKKYILRVKFEQQSTVKSRMRDGTPVIKPPPRQVTIRCLSCDSKTANDLDNTGAAPTSAGGPSTATNDTRNPLIAAGVNAGLCCPRCGSHLPRCAVCMEYVGVPRSDKPELSNDPAIRRMANFPTFCLKCKHAMHMDHSVAWFSRHVECPVPECRCQCNERPNRQR